MKRYWPALATLGFVLGIIACDPPPPPPPPVIVDDRDDEQDQYVDKEGSWRLVNHNSTAYDYGFSIADAHYLNRITYVAEVKEGFYDIFYYLPNEDPLNLYVTEAKFIVRGDKTTTYYINQRTKGNQWLYLGTHRFCTFGFTDAEVDLYAFSHSGDYVVADAILFDPFGHNYTTQIQGIPHYEQRFSVNPYGSDPDYSFWSPGRTNYYCVFACTTMWAKKKGMSFSSPQAYMVRMDKRARDGWYLTVDGIAQAIDVVTNGGFIWKGSGKTSEQLFYINLEAYRNLLAIEAATSVTKDSNMIIDDDVYVAKRIWEQVKNYNPCLVFLDEGGGILHTILVVGVKVDKKNGGRRFLINNPWLEDPIDEYTYNQFIRLIKLGSGTGFIYDYLANDEGFAVPAMALALD